NVPTTMTMDRARHELVKTESPMNASKNLGDHSFGCSSLPASRSKHFGVATITIVAISLLFTGCRKKASDEIDFGTFNKSVYANKYFGFNIAVPTDWSVQDREAQERLKRVG